MLKYSKYSRFSLFINISSKFQSLNTTLQRITNVPCPSNEGFGQCHQQFPKHSWSLTLEPSINPGRGFISVIHTCLYRCQECQKTLHNCWCAPTNKVQCRTEMSLSVFLGKNKNQNDPSIYTHECSLVSFDNIPLYLTWRDFTTNIYHTTFIPRNQVFIKLWFWE